jgi:hypothetical protein
VKTYFENKTESFEEFVKLMFRKFGKEIMKNIRIYYKNEFEELKKMNVTMIPELYEKMLIENVRVFGVVLLTKTGDNKLIELAKMYIRLNVEKNDKNTKKNTVKNKWLDNTYVNNELGKDIDRKE